MGIKWKSILNINTKVKELTNKNIYYLTMFQPQSPQFSNSSKANLSNFISPTRSKRIASVDNCSSSLQTHRNNNNNSNKKL